MGIVMGFVFLNSPLVVVRGHITLGNVCLIGCFRNDVLYLNTLYNS